MFEFRKMERHRPHAELLFTKIAQAAPSLAEVAGVENHDQQFDDFHRLKAPEIDVGVAGWRVAE